jgi:subfamily B ATP-binding cassette protein MsbA
VVVGIGVIKAAGYLGQFYWMGLFGQQVATDLRRELFARFGALSPTQRSRALLGDLLSRLADVTAVETAVTYALGSYVRDGLQIVILVGVALLLDWKLAGAMLLIVPLAAYPVSRLTHSALGKTREGQAKLGHLAGQVHEGLGGLRTIQAFNAQSAELRRFESHALAHRRAMVHVGWTRGAVPALMEVLGAGGLAAALAFAAFSRAVPPENLVSLLAAVVLIYQPIKDLGRVSQFAVQGAAAGERIFALLDLPVPVVDAPGAREVSAVRQAVRLEGVCFAYGDQLALDGLDLEIPVGQVTALVGPSGGGKSTLTSLLLRFEAPLRGRILLDGLEVTSATVASVRAQFSLVTQEPLLFAGSVAENIRFARLSASDAEVADAAKVACADEFIRALPRGYDSLVGERGVALSGGQRQRICLARAVLANAPVLVLDEATSSLDPQSEREVQQALARVLPGRTALLIAHRLQTVVGADRIHVLDKGQVVESGSHQSLLQRQGIYARLWALQQGQEASIASAG